MPELTYGRTLEWLYALESRRGMDFRLERLAPVLARLGDPQAAFPVIHVAGTNGKGSTSAMLHSIYSRAGYRTGLYTSPHLLSFRERIRVGARSIAEADVVADAATIRNAAEKAAVDLTFFEIATLMAFLEFRRSQVDLAVVEVGLGGRLDATNVVRPAAAVITSIGLEHRDLLGDTLEAIAAEKAGIIKPATTVVTGPLPADAVPVVAARVAACQARWLRYGDDFGPGDLRNTDGSRLVLPLAGVHQRHNAAIAAATARALRGSFGLEDEAIVDGVTSVRWPGRLETLADAPRTIVDAAHNPHAIAALRPSLEALGLPRPRVLVFGVMADKDWPDMLAALVPLFDHVVLSPVDTPRALDPRRAMSLIADFRPCEVAESAPAALAAARRRVGRDGAIVVTGSIFLVAELYRACGGVEDPFDVGRTQ
jgi:dihydrofolate synthase/folylpolyglutamate synthase